MRKYFLIYIILTMLIISCTNDKYIYYSFNGIFITRIDFDNDVHLYYGKYYSKDNLPKSYIKGYDYGINSGFLALLKFNEDKTVTVIRLDGSCEQFGKDSLISMSSFWEKMDNVKFSNWHDSISGNYNNIIEISDNLTYEKMRNKEWDHSKVNVVYPK